MASSPTPFDIFGPPPVREAPLTPPLGGLAGEMFGSTAPMPAQPSLGELIGQQPMDAPPPEERVIDKLKPGSDLHNTVRAKLDAMLNFSQGEMSKNYNRWNFMEKKVQAFIPDQDYDRLMDSLRNNKGILPPEPIQVVVPYTYATMHAAATYIATVLLGRKPVFSLNAARGTNVDSARYMEQVLQYQLDEAQGQEMLWQQIWDGLSYSFGVQRIGWRNTKGPIMQMQDKNRVFEDGLVFSGNDLTAIDPYNCFPDPRVPLHQCNRKGDFFFTRMELSETVLYDMEAAGQLKWTKEACRGSRAMSRVDNDRPSERRLRIGQSGNQVLNPANVVGFIAPYEGTVRLVPKDWKLGDKETSELWKFTWTKNGQIMQAEPLGMLHGMHPYAVQEPNSLGYEFMSLSQAEMITVFQDILSWVVSSRMENVRAAINNTFVADPARVEINDIRSSTIGRVIRMKQASMGIPIQQAIQQLQVTDVTGGHFTDVQTLRLLADTTTGVTDNLRGVQQQGGRRSATEARMTMQAGASRLSQLAVRISSQALSPMARQMILNTQQFIDPDMWVEITGDDGTLLSQQIKPELLAGSFNYQVTDGSLPMDKAALTETWKEILFGLARDPELRQRFNLVEIFKYVAELGGAKNIESFERPLPQIAPPGQTPPGQPAGAAVPAMPAMNVFGQGGPQQ